MKKMMIMNLNLQISKIYYDLVKAFNSSEANKLVSYYEDDLEINFELNMKLFFKLVYKLSENEHESLYEYLDSSLVSEFI